MQHGEDDGCAVVHEKKMDKQQFGVMSPSWAIIYMLPLLFVPCPHASGSLIRPFSCFEMCQLSVNVPVCTPAYTCTQELGLDADVAAMACQAAEILMQMRQVMSGRCCCCCCLCNACDLYYCRSLPLLLLPLLLLPLWSCCCCCLCCNLSPPPPPHLQEDEAPSDFQDYSLVALVGVAVHLLHVPLGGDSGSTLAPLEVLATRYSHDAKALQQVCVCVHV